MKKLLAFALTLAMTLSLAACGAKKEEAPAASAGKPAASAPAAETYEWTMGLSVAEDTIPFVTAKRFSELLEEKSGGRMKLAVYPNGQLGGDPELVESVQSGTYAFFCNMPSSSSAYVPAGAIFDLHGIFNTFEQARGAVDNPEFATLIDNAYQEYGFKILGYSDLGFRMLTSSKEVKSLSDLAGMKVRVMENPHQIAFWDGVGASGTPVDWNETYLALQQKTVDGCEQPYEFIVSAKLYEVQDYVYRTNHLFQYCMLVMNNDLYNSLPDDLRAIVDECSKEACLYGRETIDGRIDEREQFLVDYGTVIADPPADVMEKFAEVAEGYADDIISYCGEDIYNAYVSVLE